MSRWVRTCLVPPVKDSTLRRWWSQPRAGTRSHFPVTVGLVKTIKSLWNTYSRLRERCLLVSVLKSDYEHVDKCVYVTFLFYQLYWAQTQSRFQGSLRLVPQRETERGVSVWLNALRKTSLAILAAVLSLVLYGLTLVETLHSNLILKLQFVAEW